MTDIDKSMLSDYLVEAAEHLEEMESLLLQLVEEPENTELLNEIFRPIHSIKGAAQFIGLERSSRLAHRLEDLLDLLRKGEKVSSPEVVELLITACDQIAVLADELEQSQSEISATDDIVARITLEIEGQESSEEVTQEAQTTENSELSNSVTAAEPAVTKAVENEAIENEAIENEAVEDTEFKDENDQELFSIFLENLHEKIDQLRTQASSFKNAPHNTVLLARCADNIQALRSAANYMGYEELACLYTNWLEDIDEVQQALACNEEVPHDFMDGYLAEIMSLFPQPGSAASMPAPDIEAADAGSSDTEFSAAEFVADNADVNQESKQETLSENNVESSNVVDLSLLSDYLIEAAEHLEEMESLLLQLAGEPENTELLNEIFRPIHSIKGAAQFIGLDRSSRLAHHLEDLLDLLRKGERPSSPEVVDLLISARDLIACLAEELAQSESEFSSVDDMLMQITAIIEVTETPVKNAEAKAESEAVAEVEAVTAAVNTTYNEESDQELFSIFYENLREKIDLLRTQASGLKNAPDKAVLLARCTENLHVLKSAANYMRYEELTSLYSNWLEDIDEAQQVLADKEEIPDDFMDAYLAEILFVFPQLTENTTAPDTTVDTVNEKSSETLSNRQELEADVDTDTGKPEDGLHRKLSKTLDAATSQSDEVEYELLHGVFEEMMSEREETSIEKHLEAVTSSKTEQLSSERVDKVAVEQTASDKDEGQETGPSQTKPVVTKNAATDEETIEEKQSLQIATAKQENRKQGRRTEQNDQRNVDRRKNESVLKKSVRVEAEKIDSLINQVGELVVDRAFFYQLYDDMRGLQKHFKDKVGLEQKEIKRIRTFTYRMGEAIASLSRTSNELQEGVMRIRMLPISQLFNRYPRLVHDLTRNNNKKVNLEIEGEDTELDKMVVEKLSDPLIHIIRNAIDHGLEEASERGSTGKSETGTLHLKSYHESNQVVVEIKDDGRGIDPNVIKVKAIEKGIVSKEEADRMTSQEVIRLITTAGFSTANEITATSGRGVGMDIVRKNIEKLNGTMEIDSTTGKGTTIKLKIPLTLAIIPAHLVRVGENMYTIPLANIEETLRINRSETTIIEGTEVIYLRGKTLPVIHLSNLFSTNSDAKDKDKFYVVVVNTGSQKMGLVVDELLGQEEVVIKPLIDYLRDKSGFSGATIVGDGTISLILDVYEIASMTADKQSRRQHELTMARNAANVSNQAVG